MMNALTIIIVFYCVIAFVCIITFLSERSIDKSIRIMILEERVKALEVALQQKDVDLALAEALVLSHEERIRKVREGE